MNLEFAQSSHDSTSAAFSEKFEAINRATVFIATPLHIKVMKEFVGGDHRMTYLTSTFPDRLNLRPFIAAQALDELCDVGFMRYFPVDHKYSLVKRGREYVLQLDAPVETGIKTPPRTYVNASVPECLVGVEMRAVRGGANDNLMFESLPMGKQLQIVVA